MTSNPQQNMPHELDYSSDSSDQNGDDYCDEHSECSFDGNDVPHHDSDNGVVYEKDGEKFINTDMTAPRKEWIFDPPACICKWLKDNINDERDLPIAYLFFNIAVTYVPLNAVLLIFDAPWYLCVLAVASLYAFYFTRFVLGLHYETHRPLFKQTGPYSFLNEFGHYFLATYFGFIPGGYKLHHVIMHHIENNQGGDLSATMYYQRDSVKEFLVYWMRHLWTISYELPKYAFTSGRTKMGIQCFLCCMIYYCGVYQLYLWRPVQTFCMFIWVHFQTSLFLMLGNWAQHIFVDPDDPFTNTKLAYNCVNTGDNQISFNDGYHVVHHENARCHWTDIPKTFMKNIPRYAADECITLKGLSVLHVAMYCFMGKWDLIADAYVHLPGEKKKTKEELIARFKRLTTKMPRTLQRPEGFQKSRKKKVSVSG